MFVNRLLTKSKPKVADIKNKSSGNSYDFSKWFDPFNMFARRTGNTLATNETIFAAVTRLSNSMASLPLKLYQDYNPVHNHVADLVANSPSPNMTSFDFIRTMEVLRNTNGNAYALKIYGSNYQIESFQLLDPTKVEPVIERDTKELWYQIDADKGRYYVHNMDMIHVKHIHANTGYKGISPIDVLKNTIDFDGKVKTFSLEQMDSAIKASFILRYATNLSKDKKTEIIQNFKDFYQENGGVIIQESGAEIHPIERHIIDTQLFEVEKITRSRVAIVYTMPLHMLGDTSGTSYSSMEHMSLEYVQGTLVPIVRMYEQEFNRKVLTDQQRRQGYAFKFNVNALLRGDMKTRSEFYFKGIRTGLLKPNECRAWEELPPEKGGEKLYMSRDLSPIDERKEGNQQKRLKGGDEI